MWRDTMRPVRLLFFDARVVVFLIIAMVHISKWTLGTAGLAIVAFWFCERYGLTVPAALRWVRSTIAGPHRPAVPQWKKRRMV